MITGQDVEKKDLEYILSKTKKEFKILGGKTILFTGAGGFLGYYFLKSIITFNQKYPRQKIQVYALDLFQKGVPDWLKQSKFKILKKNITKYQLPINIDFDYIIHAASIASPTFYRQFPIETINANVKGLYNILNYLLKRQQTKSKIKGLLFFSSSEIYGDPSKNNIPTPETYRGNVSCTGPRSCYDESKRFCETLCVNYAKAHDLPIKIVRPFNNFGPGLKLGDKRVIPDFANNILQNQNITIFSQGSPTRTFCYITDAIIGYIKVLIKGKPAESYNIGVEEEEISMLNLAKKMRVLASKLFAYKGKVVIKKSQDKNYLIDSPNRRCPKIAKAKNELGFKPKITLEEGLLHTFLWYRYLDKKI